MTEGNWMPDRARHEGEEGCRARLGHGTMRRGLRRRGVSGEAWCCAQNNSVPETDMRLSEDQVQTIRRVVAEHAGDDARVRLFGSRLDDAARGGDVDLLVELDDATGEPAVLAARIGARLSRALDGRKVDVVLLAPNLQRLPIHDTALREGRLL